MQGFDDQKLRKKIKAGKNLYFYDQKLQFTYGIPIADSIKNVRAKGEAFSPQKRTSNMKFLNIFIFLWVIIVALLIESGSNPDPDRKHWYECKQ